MILFEIFECLFCFFYGTLSKNDPCRAHLLAGPNYATESGTFSYGALLQPLLPARTANGGYWGFLWTKGTPKYISRNRAALVNISREQGNNNFGGSESGSLENSSFSMHWPYAFVIVHRQSQCFDALLIFKRMLMSEIYAPNLRYVLCTQIPTILYAHGEWECLQSKFVNCCHTMS